MDYALYPILIMAGCLFVSNVIWGWKNEDSHNASHGEKR